jgi:hypothetical protein
MFGFHFTAETLRDGSPIPPTGEWLLYRGPVVMCEHGLHASPRPFNAFLYAPGCLLHYVELDDVSLQLESTARGLLDKAVSSRRRILVTIDARKLLWYFIHRCFGSLHTGEKKGIKRCVSEYTFAGECVELFSVPVLPTDLGTEHRSYVRVAQAYWKIMSWVFLGDEVQKWKHKTAKLFDEMVKEEFELQANYSL